VHVQRRRKRIKGLPNHPDNAATINCVASDLKIHRLNFSNQTTEQSSEKKEKKKADKIKIKFNNRKS